MTPTSQEHHMTTSEPVSSPWCDENDTALTEGDWVLTYDLRGRIVIERVNELAYDDGAPFLALANGDDPSPSEVTKVVPYPADAEEPDWFHDSVGGRWVGPVGDGTITVEIFGDELASLLAAVREAADFPVDHVQLFTDAAGEHRWRAIARNGQVVAGSGEGYRNASHARTMAERLFPGVEIRDEVEL